MECNSIIPDKFIQNICEINISYKYYYDNISSYFSHFKSGKKLIKGLFFLLKIIISFLINLFPLLIIQKLDPVYYICTNSVFYFILQIIGLFKDSIKIYSIFEHIAELFSIIGICIYLELIELNCYELNYDIKRKIEERSKEELIINQRTESVDSNGFPFV